LEKKRKGLRGEGPQLRCSQGKKEYIEQNFPRRKKKTLEGRQLGERKEFKEIEGEKKNQFGTLYERKEKKRLTKQLTALRRGKRGGAKAAISTRGQTEGKKSPRGGTKRKRKPTLAQYCPHWKKEKKSS